MSESSFPYTISETALVVLGLKFISKLTVILSEVWRAFCAKRSRKPALSEVEWGPAVRVYDLCDELLIHRSSCPPVSPTRKGMKHRLQASPANSPTCHPGVAGVNLLPL